MNCSYPVNILHSEYFYTCTISHNWIWNYILYESDHIEVAVPREWEIGIAI